MFKSFFIILILSAAVFAQREVLTNSQIAGMTAAGLSPEIISKKIETSKNKFDVSANALIDLKKAGVDEAVISLMMTKQQTGLPAEQIPPLIVAVKEPAAASEKKAVESASTIAFSKSSLQPSISALEKELLKRPDWRSLNLTIVRYGAQADLFAEINFVHGSVLSHRYTYRIVDRLSGTVIAAGETTSWGSLAENLARHISKRLVIARNG